MKIRVSNLVKQNFHQPHKILADNEFVNTADLENRTQTTKNI